ncbi:MAG: protein-tyrosine phosphatase [Acidimicrobiaceae bacterium]|jgi:protein-tyrosine phosphatase|nr:protein-tyrosine phosphatase [Acidimicrobiaceae bacterium]
MVNALNEVRVERDDDGVLVVWWATDDPVAVDVGVGVSPVAEEHTPFLSSTTSTPVRLGRLGPERRYVSLTPAGGGTVVVAERRVPLAGITNLRDLGGYPTADGGTTRWGRVFRADALHKLTDADLIAFHSLGVRTVYDLRGQVERTDFPGPVDSLHVPIIGRPADAVPPAPPADMTTADGERMLRDMYVGSLEHSATHIGTILRGIADPDHVPAVFHCHGGKDRTGVVAAVLLLALRVEREIVLDDYEATRRYRLIEDQQDSLANILAAGVSPEAAAGVLGTPRWAMAAAVDAIDDAYAGIDAYLTGPAGLTAGEVSSLREHLIVPAQRS